MEITSVDPKLGLQIFSTVIKSLTTILTITVTFVTFSFLYFSKTKELPLYIENVLEPEKGRIVIAPLLFLIPLMFALFSFNAHDFIVNDYLGNFMLFFVLITVFICFGYTIVINSVRIHRKSERVESKRGKFFIKSSLSLLFGVFMSAIFWITLIMLKFRVETQVPFIVSIAFGLIIFAFSYSNKITNFLINKEISRAFLEKMELLWIICLLLMTTELILPILDTILESFIFMGSLNPSSIQVDIVLNHARNSYFIFLFYIFSVGSIALIYNQLMQSARNTSK